MHFPRARTISSACASRSRSRARTSQRGSGGPFGAAIFARGASRPLAVGVNCVERLRNAVLHAEIVALMLAEARLGSYTLRAPGAPEYELFTSCAPCAMCLGATLWSGVRRIVCAAGREDAMALGFDEGPVFPEILALPGSAGHRARARPARRGGGRGDAPLSRGQRAGLQRLSASWVRLSGTANAVSAWPAPHSDLAVSRPMRCATPLKRGPTGARPRGARPPARATA